MSRLPQPLHDLAQLEIAARALMAKAAEIKAGAEGRAGDDVQRFIDNLDAAISDDIGDAISKTADWLAERDVPGPDLLAMCRREGLDPYTDSATYLEWVRGEVKQMEAA
jgi:hypothetical protein